MSRTVLAVASGGGHLKQLMRLIALIEDVERVDWLTYDSALGRELYEQSRTTQGSVYFAPTAAPKQFSVLVKDAQVAWRLLRRRDFDLVVSTGGTIALTVLPLARAMGVPATYVESATRSNAPSTTGKILQYVPGVRCLTQYPGYAGRRWEYIGSVFDEYEPGPVRADSRVRRVLVTVGTIEAYPFGRLVEKLTELIRPGWEVVWQLGDTPASGLEPSQVFRTLPADQMRERMRWADVVVTHAGTGTALSAFEEGVCPVVVPRRAEHGEHGDDHQRLTVTELTRRGLAVGLEVEQLTEQALERAAQQSVRRRPGSISLPI